MAHPKLQKLFGGPTQGRSYIGGGGGAAPPPPWPYLSRQIKEKLHSVGKLRKFLKSAR